MVKTTPRPRHPKGYTIVESLVVLGILAVLSWVVLALIKHDKKSSDSGNPKVTAPISAETGGKPVAPTPPARNDAPKE